MSSTMNSKPAKAITTATPKGMGLDDLLAQLMDDDTPQPRATSAPATFHPAPSAPAMAPMVDVVSDVASLIGELQQDVSKQTGVIGLIKAKIRGDEFQRRQIASLVKRVDALNATEEAKVVLFLALSLRTIAVDAAMNAIDTQHRLWQRYDPNSPASIIGQRMIERNMDYLVTLAEDITQRGINRGMRAVGLDR